MRRTYVHRNDRLQFFSNTVSGSLLTPSLVTFMRGQVSLGVNPQSQYQWLHNASFTITDPHGALAGGWIHHLETDPILGSCPNDQTNELLGNVLTYNGQVVPYQKNF